MRKGCSALGTGWPEFIFYHFILACKYNSFKLSHQYSAEPITPSAYQAAMKPQKHIRNKYFSFEWGGLGLL